MVIFIRLQAFIFRLISVQVFCQFSNHLKGATILTAINKSIPVYKSNFSFAIGALRILSNALFPVKFSHHTTLQAVSDQVFIKN